MVSNKNEKKNEQRKLDYFPDYSLPEPEAVTVIQ